jgi:hypothetical protein
MQKDKLILLLTTIFIAAFSLPVFGANAPKYQQIDLQKAIPFNEIIGGNEEIQWHRLHLGHSHGDLMCP